MRAFFASLALLGTVAAQPALNCFEITPHKLGDGQLNCRQYVTRWTLAAGGDFDQAVPGSHFRGVGTTAVGQTCEALGHCVSYVDWDASTMDAYDIVIRPDDAAMPGRPSCDPALECRMGPFSSPGGGAGTVAYDDVIVWSAPCRLPCCDTFWIGFAPQTVSANPPTDSLWQYMVFFEGRAPAAADVNRLEPICDCTPAIAGGCSGGTAGTTNDREMWIGILVECPVLNMGGIDPMLPAAHRLNLGTRGGVSYGAAGMWLCCRGGGDDYGIAARVRHTPAANGIAALFFGLGNCPGIPIGICRGALYLLPSPLVLVGFIPLDANGCGSTTVLPQNAGVCFPGARFDFQAVAVDAAFQCHLSNGATSEYCNP